LKNKPSVTDGFRLVQTRKTEHAALDLWAMDKYAQASQGWLVSEQRFQFSLSSWG